VKENLVIVPTYNEKDNILVLISEIMKLNVPVDVLVVDDSSPDGTGELVKALSKENSRVHLLSRQKKEGLGRAYIAGFQWGLDQGYKRLIEMDADFSHRPKDLESIIQNFQDSQFVIGSRYVPGGATVNWGWLRLFISKGGSFYSRLILGFPVNDWTGGFNFWNREVLEAVKIHDIRSNGYSFQIELKYRALKKGFKFKELPIVFEDRRVGQSKMSSKIVFEALYKVWLIRNIV